MYKKSILLFHIPVESINIFINSELEKYQCMILGTELLRKNKNTKKGNVIWQSRLYRAKLREHKVKKLK